MENLAYIDEFNEIKTELIDGEIVMMSPKPRLEHGTVVTNISAEFRLNLKGKTCRAYCDGVDVFIDEKNIFVPDVMIVCNPTIRKKTAYTARRIWSWRFYHRLRRTMTAGRKIYVRQSRC